MGGTQKTSHQSTQSVNFKALLESGRKPYKDPWTPIWLGAQLNTHPTRASLISRTNRNPGKFLKAGPGPKWPHPNVIVVRRRVENFAFQARVQDRAVGVWGWQRERSGPGGQGSSKTHDLPSTSSCPMCLPSLLSFHSRSNYLWRRWSLETVRMPSELSLTCF